MGSPLLRGRVLASGATSSLLRGARLPGVSTAPICGLLVGMPTQPEPASRDLESHDILSRVGDQLGVRRVFGESTVVDGITVIPVAVAIGGGGAGAAPGEGTGGGFGGLVWGTGVYTVSEGRVRFVPAIDVTALAALGVLAIGLAARVTRRRPS